MNLAGRVFVAAAILLAGILLLAIFWDVFDLLGQPLTGQAATRVGWRQDDTTSAPIYGENEGMQSFRAGGGFTLTSVKVKVAREGAPASLIATIALASNPSSPLSTGFVSGATVLTTPGWVEITMASYEIEPGIEYVLILRATGNATNYVVWSLDSNGGYRGGEFTYEGT